jgi:hypothetical protein
MSTERNLKERHKKLNCMNILRSQPVSSKTHRNKRNKRKRRKRKKKK